MGLAGRFPPQLPLLGSLDCAKTDCEVLIMPTCLLLLLWHWLPLHCTMKKGSYPNHSCSNKNMSIYRSGVLFLFFGPYTRIQHPIEVYISWSQARYSAFLAGRCHFVLMTEGISLFPCFGTAVRSQSVCWFFCLDVVVCQSNFFFLEKVG